MTTFDELIDRTLREWLQPPDDQPLRFTLNGAITDSASSLTYHDTLLPPEQEEVLGPGTLLEPQDGTEQILAGTVDAGTDTISDLVRGANGTGAQSHADDAEVVITPTFSRKAIFDALGDAVLSLHPRLFQLKSSQLTVDEDYNEAPSDLLSPVSFTYVNDNGKPVEANVEWANPFPDSSTGKVVVVKAPKDKTGYLNYRARFTRPAATDYLLDPDDIDDAETQNAVGVKNRWAQLLIVGAVHRLLTSRDISAATQEFLTRQLSQQGFPVPSGARIRDGLVRYYEDLLQSAIADQHAEHETTMVATFPTGSPWL